ncbi:hypothetical protein SNOG_01096 [Parastagonospora nodorum SN15]|uniref:Uncharacterized protein n=1 Tax=Phaeosphaeria nodorum (strain SN15 / ATCC MYA-4574 / FGSC 10173) TaxID=321614 RepID=Q0V4G8_PHANO|nr:hypothetical protein SNOG_01096 [Parastagonospora nodorum SN15]EAT92591.1 hypothetical protein SNOG_01096 [Parastagonospora nodorum SN15]
MKAVKKRRQDQDPSGNIIISNPGSKQVPRK